MTSLSQDQIMSTRRMILDCLSGLDTDQVPQTSFIMSFDSLSDECIIYIEAGRHLICPNNPRSVSEIKPERPNGTITLYQRSEMRRRERDEVLHGSTVAIL
jgi:hypothetical protein